MSGPHPPAPAEQGACQLCPVALVDAPKARTSACEATNKHAGCVQRLIFYTFWADPAAEPGKHARDTHGWKQASAPHWHKSCFLQSTPRKLNQVHRLRSQRHERTHETVPASARALRPSICPAYHGPLSTSIHAQSRLKKRKLHTQPVTSSAAGNRSLRSSGWAAPQRSCLPLRTLDAEKPGKDQVKFACHLRSREATIWARDDSTMQVGAICCPSDQCPESNARYCLVHRHPEHADTPRAPSVPD